MDKNKNKMLLMLPILDFTVHATPKYIYFLYIILSNFIIIIFYRYCLLNILLI